LVKLHKKEGGNVNLNKRGVIVLSLFFLFLLTSLGWNIYEHTQLQFPRWEGTSEDGNWKAIIAKEKGGHPDTFTGTVFWEGEKKELKKKTISLLQLQADGKYYTGDDTERTEKWTQKWTMLKE